MENINNMVIEKGIENSVLIIINIFVLIVVLLNGNFVIVLVFGLVVLNIDVV